MDFRNRLYLKSCIYNCPYITEFLLKQTKVDVETRVPDDHARYPGYTGLHFAATRGQLRLVKRYLNKNASIIVQDAKERKTALHMAYYRQHDDIARLMALRERDYLSCPSDDRGLSHLHLAAFYGVESSVRGFLQAESGNVNARLMTGARPGRTALHFAVEAENANIVRILLEAGADPNISDRSLMTPLHYACVYNKIKFNQVNLLLRQKKQKELMNWLSDERRMLIIDLLLRYGANINATDRRGRSPIFSLFTFVVPNIIEQMEVIDKRVLLGIQERHLVIRMRNAIANKLLDFGCDIEVTDRKGHRLLYYLVLSYAADRSVFDVIERLARMRIDVGYVNESRRMKYPLFVACRENWQPVVDLLLQYGSDPNLVVCDDTLLTPFYVYVEKWCFHTERKDSCECYMLKRFLDQGADLNHQLRSGKTLLHYVFSRCVRNGIDQIKTIHVANLVHFAEKLYFQRDLMVDCEFVTRLLDLDCELDAQDTVGRTPLHYACLRHDLHDVLILIHQGASIEVEDHAGKTPLNCCNDEDCSFRLVFVPYVSKLQRVGVYVSTQNRRLIDNFLGGEKFKFADEIIQEEFVELNNLRKIKLDSFTTLADVLVKLPSKMSFYVKNPIFQRTISTRHFRLSYPSFQSLIVRKFREGNSRLAVLEPVKQSLRHLTNVNIPDHCIEYITDYLDDRHLKQIICAAKN